MKYILAFVLLALVSAEASACGPLSRLRPRAVIARNVERTRTMLHAGRAVVAAPVGCQGGSCTRPVQPVPVPAPIKK